MAEEKSTFDRWMIGLRHLVGGLIIILFSIVIAYKIYSLPTGSEANYSDLAALILALFSIGLAALFYIKNSELSSKFYDRSFRYNKQFSEDLAGIRGSFGELLNGIGTSVGELKNQVGVLRDTIITDATTKLKEGEDRTEDIVKMERAHLIRSLGQTKISDIKKEEFIFNYDELTNKRSTQGTSKEEWNQINNEIANLFDQVAGLVDEKHKNDVLAERKELEKELNRSLNRQFELERRLLEAESIPYTTPPTSINIFSPVSDVDLNPGKPVVIPPVIARWAIERLGRWDVALVLQIEELQKLLISEPVNFDEDTCTALFKLGIIDRQNKLTLKGVSLIRRFAISQIRNQPTINKGRIKKQPLWSTDDEDD